MQEKSPEPGQDYCDLRGKVWKIAGTARNWKTLEEMIILNMPEEGMYVISAAEFTKEFKEVNECHRGSLLYDFLDAKSVGEKLSIIQKRRSEITDEFLEAAAQSMDFVINGEDMESHLLDLENFLRTKIKYERKRM